MVNWVYKLSQVQRHLGVCPPPPPCTQEARGKAGLPRPWIFLGLSRNFPILPGAASTSVSSSRSLPRWWTMRLEDIKVAEGKGKQCSFSSVLR